MTADAPAGHLCIVGSVNLDTTLRVTSLPGPGETSLAVGSHRSLGGKGANQAVAAAALGSRVSLVAAVGDDDQGSTGLEHLRSRGVEVGCVQVTGAAPTGSAVVLVADDSENLIVVDPGANATLDPAWVREQVSGLDADVTVAQLEVPLTALLAAAQAAPSRLFVLNPAPMVTDVAELDALLERADILVPNRLELGQLAGRGEPASLDEVDECAAVLEFRGTLVVTLGREGAAVYGPGGRDRLAQVPAARVEAVDTSGAGDAFCGVLADRLARGDDVVAAVTRASELASLSTTFTGAQVPATFPRTS